MNNYKKYLDYTQYFMPFESILSPNHTEAILASTKKINKKINKEQHTTIILTTHDTGDIKALAKRILLIGKGKLLMDGTIDDLLEMTRQLGGSLDDTIAKIYSNYNIA